jgi:DNA (cytosine-5)-methyltransferase 1
MRSIELFAGAGGLALGVANAGFRHEAVVEWDENACATIRENKHRGVIDWPLFQGDVRELDYSSYKKGIDLLAGGPPCQPFSIGGKHRGYNDIRNMFPEAIRAVRELEPKAILFENVKGLLRESFAKYYEYVILQITYPELEPRSDEEWTSHLSRLGKYHTKGKHDGLHYRVVFRLLNAADYGIPQRRERVLIVGLRSDLNIDWSFPPASHSQEALLRDKWGTGVYWERHRIPRKKRPGAPAGIRQQLDFGWFGEPTKAWVTVRDALNGLPDPREEVGSPGFLNHRLVPGARSYQGHTGSPLDEPAKTLKAGDHGVPGGENTMALEGGAVRYFTVRESARLQTFPDNYAFFGSWTEMMRQLGNAVPVSLGGAVAASVRSTLEGCGR